MLVLPYQVRVVGDPLLTARALPVPAGDARFGAELSLVVRRMLVTMERAGGVGLAAPQVGLPLRVFVARLGGWELAAVNPVVLASSGSQLGEEGCLSVPGRRVVVERADAIRISAQDPSSGRPFAVDLAGLAARVVLHEIDHLDGVLIA